MTASERPGRRVSASAARWAALVALPMLLGTAACAERAALTDDDLAERGQAPQRGIDPLRVERAIHARINAIRSDAGLQPLGWSAPLLPIARAHSADMIARDYFAHNNPDGQGPVERYAARGFQCRTPITATRFATGGENIAQTHLYTGYRTFPDGRRVPYGARSEAAIAERVVDGWMNSPGHRDNILRAYWKTEAIGVIIDAQGRVFATQNFC